MADNTITINLDNDITVNLGDNEVTVEASSLSTLKNYVDAGDKLYLNGNGGDTYLQYDDDEDALYLYVNGEVKRKWD